MSARHVHHALGSQCVVLQIGLVTMCTMCWDAGVWCYSWIVAPWVGQAECGLIHGSLPHALGRPNVVVVIHFYVSVDNQRVVL